MITAREARDLNHCHAYAAQIDGDVLRVRMLHARVVSVSRFGSGTIRKEFSTVEMQITDGRIDAGYLCYLLSEADA